MHRSFRKPDKDPLSFDVGPEPDDEFSCVARCPAAYLIDLALVTGADGASADQQVQGFIDFMEKVLIDADRERFTARLSDRERPIDMETLNEVGEWLLGEYTGRPPETPSASPTRPSNTGGLSTAAAPLPESIRSTSLPVGS